MDHCDVDYSGRIDADEFVNALLYEFDLTVTSEEYSWIGGAVCETCGEYEINGDGKGLNLTETTWCLENRGIGIWNGIKEWAAYKKNGYNVTVWNTILANADTNSDGEWSAAEARDALFNYFNFTVTINPGMNNTFDRELNESCSAYDGDSSGALN